MSSATNTDRRIALLRAVNVGGTGKLAMADLRTLATDLGYADPATIVQSGNLVFGGAKGPDPEIETTFENELAKRFALGSDVMVRTPGEWRALVAANPFAAEAEEDPRFVHAMVLKTSPEPETLTALREAIVGREQVELDGATLYLHYPDGAGRSKLTNVLIERKLGIRGTARNWNTVMKIAAALERR